MANFTEQAIIQSFLELLDEKPFHKITVKEIVDKCQINRNTFYYHFEDMYDLLEKVFEDEIERLKITTISCDNWQDIVMNATSFLIKSKKRILHVFNSLGQKELKNYLKQIFSISIVHYYNPTFQKYNVSEKDKRFLVKFYTDALTGIALEWIENGLEEDYVYSFIDLTDKWFANTLERQIKHYYDQTH